MDMLYEKLLKYLQREDKEQSLELCMEVLKSGEIEVVELYEEVLTPALNNIIHENLDEVDNLIWKEHVRSGIIRTIIENSFSFVLKDKIKYNFNHVENVIVMCPKFEDHDIGARMVSDFFTIAGYNSTFIGANTPESTILKAIESINPKYISMSITNYYNLVATKKTINRIKENSPKITFLLGGYAFNNNPNIYKDIGGDYLLKSFQDVLNLSREVGSN
jgi:methanogenic corrinoid protein MtbC1